MNNEELDELGGQITKQTGVTPKEQTGAASAQAAAEKTDVAADFVAHQIVSDILPRESDQKPTNITLISPYSENQLEEQEKLLRDAGIEFKHDFHEERHKPHLLSALTFASQIGFDSDKILRALNDHIEQETKRLSYLQDRSEVTYQSGNYFVEEYIVRSMAQRKGLEVPENFKPTDKRRSFMATLAGSLDKTERQHLAQYVVSTQAGFSFSPFYLPVSWDISNKEDLRRQNIAVAIAPKSFKQESIATFLSQEGIQKEKFLLAMANHHLAESMPFGVLLASEYRVTLQDSLSDKKEVSMRESLEEQIGRSYTEKPTIGSEPRGLLPFEELAGLVVVDNLKQLTQEGLESRFTQIIPQVLASEKPLAELEEAFPDVNLFYDRGELDSLATKINALREAIVHPDQVPPESFWDWVFTRPDKNQGFLTRVKDTLIQLMYQAGGERHLQRWREVVESFVVSKGKDRTGEPLTLLLNYHSIDISGKDGPICSLIKRKDGQWYPTLYWDINSQKSVFDIKGMPYEELRREIASSPFEYQIRDEFFKEILREKLAGFGSKVYDWIKTQVNLEAMKKAEVYPSHAAIAYRKEGPLKNFQYLIGGMTPYGVGIYDSIFSNLVRHLWQHKKLAETDLSVSVPLTGEEHTIRNRLLELQNLSFEEIQKRLKETNVDVRVPEVTIRKSEGSELRAKAWVYDTLMELKGMGFDAVLGKTMAEEFNRQAARIYVESALTDLNFLPENYQREKPLAALQDRQQAIYNEALKLGFRIPLENNYHLAKSLSLPLTWEREKQLIKFLDEKLAQDELQKFYNKIGISDDYFQTRDVVETFLNFASGWDLGQFDRSNEFPTKHQSLKEMNQVMSWRQGEYGISTQAQERFETAKKTWKEFLKEIKKQTQLLDDQQKQKMSPIVKLGNDLVAEIDEMSQAKVTEWAEKIIKGEMAAVGRDMQRPIEVKTWTDFHEAIRQLMDTAKLVLIYRSEKGRFGWEVSTDKAEVS